MIGEVWGRSFLRNLESQTWPLESALSSANKSRRTHTTRSPYTCNYRISHMTPELKRQPMRIYDIADNLIG